MDLEKKVEQLEKDLAEVKNLLLAQNKAFPQIGDYYYTIFVNGSIEEYTWENTELDRIKQSLGNVFETIKEAEAEIEKRKLLAEIKQWRKVNDPDSFKLDWTNESEIKYSVHYDYKYKKFSWNTWNSAQTHSVIFYSSQTKVFELIAHFGNRLNLLLEGGN